MIKTQMNPYLDLYKINKTLPKALYVMNLNSIETLESILSEF